MSTFLKQKEFYISYNPHNSAYEEADYYSADSAKEAIEMCESDHKNCLVREVRFIHYVKRKSTKTVTIDV